MLMDDIFPDQSSSLIIGWQKDYHHEFIMQSEEEAWHFYQLFLVTEQVLLQCTDELWMRKCLLSSWKVFFNIYTRKGKKSYQICWSPWTIWSYQKSELVKELMKNWNANWIYLPPYSPELASIELMFRSLKAKIRVCSGEEEVYFSSQH